jgi:hypothetical protein
MSIEIALAVLLLVMVWYVWQDSHPAKEHMVSEDQVALISRGFNQPLAPDYSNLQILYGAEHADKTTDITLSSWQPPAN